MSETDWMHAEMKPGSELAKLHFFSLKKQQGDRTVDFRITIWEFAERNKLMMRYFAQADKEINQKTMPYIPSGWGETMLNALNEAVREIHRFPYEGE